MIRNILIAVLMVFLANTSNAQDTIQLHKDDATYVLYGIIIDGDTLLLSSIDEVYIFPQKKFKSRRDLRRYRRLVRNVKKAYPYAKLAKKKLIEIETNLAKLETEKARKAYVKQAEKEIREEYEDELKKLTITQGRILIKLIDRETGETSYELLKQLRGSFSAFFWQALARLFGSNLKTEFDAQGEDKLINEIVILIENGQL
ncbi:MAG: DUF4294 domain-containing protein [Bacteroidales bacterium]|nr:MAG: DUF4294 domain-containing protein [Bacteroidales bacterium]